MEESDSRKLIRDRLEEIARTRGGRLEPSAVVDDARSEDSPLHELFEWDDGVAAERYRECQARHIIASVRVTVETQERTVTVPAYVRNPMLPSSEQGYASIWDVRGEEEAMASLMVQEFTRARSALSRARSIAAVLNMTKEVDELIEGLGNIERRVLVRQSEARQ